MILSSSIDCALRKTNRHRASTEPSLIFRVQRYVVIATKPVHRLQILPIIHN